MLATTSGMPPVAFAITGVRAATASKATRLSASLSPVAI